MNLTIKEILTFGWNTTKKQYKNILLVFALIFFINGAINFIIDSLGDSVNHSSIFGLFLFIAFVFIDLVFQIGVTKEALVIVRGGEGDIYKTFKYYNLFFKAILAWILYGIFIVGISFVSFLPFIVATFFSKQLWVLIFGLVVAFLVGILISIVYGFSRIIVVDKETGPLEALKQSKELTKGVLKQLVLIFITLTALNILGVILLGIGLLVTIPMTYFAILFVYNSLVLRQFTPKA